MKATTIEETQHVSKLKLDELIGSLLTFEMEINDKSEKKSKSVVFKTEVKEHNDQLEDDIDENFS